MNFSVRQKKKTLLSWSSGKDCAWALHLLRQDPETDLQGLFTVMNQKYDHACMHATRPRLLQLQAEAAGLPIELIHVPDPCSKEQSDAIMREFVAHCLANGIEQIAFGDLFLEELRHYRENQLAGTGLEPVFPLWNIPTDALAEQMLDAGVAAYVSSVDLSKLPVRYAGQKWTKELIESFPAGTDPCGEHGEIHTVVVGGPMFQRVIPIAVGDIVQRDGFAYADLIPRD